MSWRWPWQRQNTRRMVWANFDRRPGVDPPEFESYEDMIARLADVPLCTAHSHDEPEPAERGWNATTRTDWPVVTAAALYRSRGAVWRDVL